MNPQARTGLHGIPLHFRTYKRDAETREHPPSPAKFAVAFRTGRAARSRARRLHEALQHVGRACLVRVPKDQHTSSGRRIDSALITGDMQRLLNSYGEQRDEP